MISDLQQKTFLEAMRAYQLGIATSKQKGLLAEHVSPHYDPYSDDCSWCRYGRLCAEIRQKYDLR